MDKSNYKSLFQKKVILFIYSLRVDIGLALQSLYHLFLKIRNHNLLQSYYLYACKYICHAYNIFDKVKSHRYTPIQRFNRCVGK